MTKSKIFKLCCLVGFVGVLGCGASNEAEFREVPKERPSGVSEGAAKTKSKSSSNTTTGTPVE